MCQCADFLGSDYLVGKCQKVFSKDAKRAMGISSREEFNTDTISASLFEQLLVNTLERKEKEWHQVVANWLSGSGSNVAIYGICQKLCNKLLKGILLFFLFLFSGRQKKFENLKILVLKRKKFLQF